MQKVEGSNPFSRFASNPKSLIRVEAICLQ